MIRVRAARGAHRPRPRLLRSPLTVVVNVVRVVGVPVVVLVVVVVVVVVLGRRRGTTSVGPGCGAVGGGTTDGDGTAVGSGTLMGAGTSPTR